MSGWPRMVSFGNGLVTAAEPDAAEVGNKAANLIRLSRLGLQVPPGFVLGTSLCRDYFSGGLPEGLRERLAVELRQLENVTGSFFGSRRRPLLLAVRSGAPVSMPGMMDTVLNLGVNDATVQALIRRTGNPRLAWDCYRRLLETYGEVVLECPAHRFEEIVDRAVEAAAVDGVHELDAAALEAVTASLLAEVNTAGREFPQDPMTQLVGAVEAVLRSWRSDRARAYRRANGLDEAVGTAVTIQAMVFGNAGATSGSGVGFTRDPATGADELYLDFVFNAQGEDVVGGRKAVADAGVLRRLLPDVYAELQRTKTLLETELSDLQDFEFTVEGGELFLLQTRAGKRTPWAALQIAVDLVREGTISPRTALARLAELDLERLERRRLAVGVEREALACATAAGLGVAVGEIALTPARALEMAAAGRAVVLVRRDTSTEDYEGMAAAEGVLTQVGGRTSHAAVVARQLGKVCLVGCSELELDAGARLCRIAGGELAEGDELSLDGDSGKIYAGALPVVRERPSEALAEVRRWQARSIH